MRQLSATRPIFGIALTGFGMEEDIRKSHDGGFGHHLIKPVDLNRLDSHYPAARRAQPELRDAGCKASVPGVRLFSTNPEILDKA